MEIPVDMMLLSTPQAAVLDSKSQVLRLSMELFDRLLLSPPVTNEADRLQHVRTCLLTSDPLAAALSAVEVLDVAESVEARLLLRDRLLDHRLGYAASLLIGRLAALASDWLAAEPVNKASVQLGSEADRRQRRLLWLACCYWTNTRVVHCPGLNRIALVPYFDLFNHSPAVSVETSYDASNMRLIITTKTAYKIGDQVFINYGNHSNLTLLIEYDFVLGPLPSEHDCVPIGLDYISSLFPASDKKLGPKDVLDQFAEMGLCPPADALLSDSLMLLKYFHVSIDGPSYYLLLLLFMVKSASCNCPCQLSNVVHSMTEDQLSNCLQDELTKIYSDLKMELLRDRNQLAKLVSDWKTLNSCCGQVFRLLDNCIQLLDIWCNIVNCFI